MTTAKNIAKNTGVLVLSQIITYLLGFIYIVYVARYLGAEGYGILSFGLAFTGIFAVAVDLGLNTITTRDLSRDVVKSSYYLSNLTMIKLVLSIIVFLLIALTINLLGYPFQTVMVVYFLGLYVIVAAFSQMFYAIYQAYEKMEYQSAGQVLNTVLILILTLAAIYFHANLILISSIYLIGSIIVLFYNIIITYWKFAKFKLSLDRNFWSFKIREALPFGLTSIYGTIYTYIDSVMLSLMQGDLVVGWYSAAYRLILIVLYLPGIINQAIFPAMSKFYISSDDILRKIQEKFFKYMLILGFPIGVGTTLLAEKIILLIFGEGFLPSILALQVLIWTIVITFCGSAFVKLFEASGRQMAITKVTGLGVAVNIALNLFLIPIYSFIGASIATVLTEMVVIGSIVGLSYHVGYGIPVKENLILILKVIISGIAMGIVLWYFDYLSLIILVIIAVFVYIAALFITRVFDSEDLTLLRNILKIN
ncbi:MAG: flippase [Methanobacteriaceae archaeon]|nr:flippase [Methanobacteriaceae archaeon]